MKKKHYIQMLSKGLFSALVVIFFITSAASAQWTIYNAIVLPDANDPAFSQSNVAGTGHSNQLIADPDNVDNYFLELITETNADNFMWSTPLSAESPGLTLVMKVKAANDVARRVVEVDLHHNGLRERFYINREDNRVRLNEAIGGGDGGEIPAPDGINLSDWNIYRLTKQDGNIALYLNEDPVPIATGITATATTQQYFRFGDGNGSHNIAVLMDWLIWDTSGAYAPGEGTPIPEDLLDDVAFWTMYDASVLPNATVPVFSTSSGSFSADENEIIDDPDMAGNKLLRMDVPGHADGQQTQTQFYWRMNFASHSVDVTDLTVVMRAKGNPIRDLALDLDMHYNNFRSRVTVHNANNQARVRNGIGNDTILDVDVTQWNTYRFAMTATETNLYVNEQAEPALTFIPQGATSGNRHFRFGDGDSGNTFGADVDWVIWDVTGAYAPGEGAPIPEVIVTPSWNADLAELNLDGVLIDGFAPGTLNYEVALPIGTEDVPVVSAVASDDAANVVVTQAVTIPGTATVLVTAENGITTRTYTVDFRFISDDATLQEIAVNGELIEDFDPEVLAYTVILPLETTDEIPVITAVATDENAEVNITQPAQIDGQATIVVTAEDGVATLTYVVDIELVSIDATLADLLADGETIAGFDPDVLEYTLLFPDETSDLPVITAVANNENATLVITQATGIPGQATVEVTAEDGVTELTYVVNYLTGSNDATLSDLMVDGVTIEGFDPDVTEYFLVLPAGTTDIPEITAVTNDENATMVITQADAIPGEATVHVTAEDQFNELVYTVFIRHISTDASLSDLQVNGITIQGFDPDVLFYEYLVPTGSTNVPVVTAVAADELATVEIIPATELPGETEVIVTAEDVNVSLTYVVSFIMVDHNWRMYDASVLPNLHIPEFDESNVAGAGATNVILNDPDNPDNNFLELITVENGDNFMWRTPLQPEEDTEAITMVMRVKAANEVSRRVIELDVHHNGIRERLYINREDNRLRLNEAIGGGDGGEIPAPEGVNLSDWNIYRLTKSGGEIKLYLNEDPEPIAQGVSATATTQQYFRFGDGNGSHNAGAILDWILWDETGAYAPGEGSPIPDPVVTPNGDATLAELLVDGVLIDDFDPAVTEYHYLLDPGTTDIPQISAVLNYPQASFIIEQATELPGIGSVEVTAFNGFTVRTYTVNFRSPSSNADLASIMIGNQPLDDFDPDVLVYDIELPHGTTEAPEVSAVADDEFAIVDVTQADVLPGQATILVTAEDGTEKVYQINFTVEIVGIDPVEANMLKLYPNPATSQLNIEFPVVYENAELFIFNTSGQMVLSKRVSSQNLTIDVSYLQKGIYIIRFINGREQGRSMFVKQ
jgi:hypothetical protein